MREFTPGEQETLQLLGNFGPTTNISDRMLKGWTIDNEADGLVKTYMSSRDLREIAEDLNSIAQWLDERATEAERKEGV